MGNNLVFGVWLGTPVAIITRIEGLEEWGREASLIISDHISCGLLGKLNCIKQLYTVVQE